MTAAEIISGSTRVEDVEVLVSVLHEFVRDGTGIVHLIVDELDDRDWDDADGRVGPSWVKTDRVGEHVVEYRRAR